MILRRFMLHIKEQNWFAVVIEVMIVVVGIFLALQADNWKQSVEDSDKDTRSLQLFSEELITMIQRADGDVNASRESALMYDALLDYFSDCSKISNYRDAFINARKAGRSLRGINVMRAGLDAVAQPTVLYRINNKELSRSVSRLMELIDFWEIRNAIDGPELLVNYQIFSSQFKLYGRMGWQLDGGELYATNDSIVSR